MELLIIVVKFPHRTLKLVRIISKVAFIFFGVAYRCCKVASSNTKIGFVAELLTVVKKLPHRTPKMLRSIPKLILVLMEFLNVIVELFCDTQQLLLKKNSDITNHCSYKFY